MCKNKIFFLIFSMFFLSFCGTFVFAATQYIDDDGNYYPQTSDQVPTWEIIVNQLGLERDDAEVTWLITSPTSAVNIADPGVAAGEVAGYYAQDLSFPAGTYTYIRFTQGAQTTFVGCVYDPVEERWRATPDGDLYDTKAEALANAGSLSLNYGDFEAERLEISPPVTVENGKDYTLKILWKNYGLEAGIPSEGEPEGDFGAGLIWNPTEGEFSDGMLRDDYLLEATD